MSMWALAYFCRSLPHAKEHSPSESDLLFPPTTWLSPQHSTSELWTKGLEGEVMPSRTVRRRGSSTTRIGMSWAWGTMRREGPPGSNLGS